MILARWSSRVVRRVVDRHRDDGCDRAGLEQKAPADFRHAEQWREGGEHHARRRADARQPFAVDFERRLFIEPHPVQRIGLPLAAALIVALEVERAVLRLHVAAAAPANKHAVERIGDTVASRPVTRHSFGTIPVPHALSSRGGPIRRRCTPSRVNSALSDPANARTGSLNTASFPPIGIAAGQMHRRFGRAGRRFADLVGRHHARVRDRARRRHEIRAAWRRGRRR